MCLQAVIKSPLSLLFFRLNHHDPLNLSLEVPFSILLIILLALLWILSNILQFLKTWNQKGGLFYIALSFCWFWCTQESLSFFFLISGVTFWRLYNPSLFGKIYSFERQSYRDTESARKRASCWICRFTPSGCSSWAWAAPRPGDRSFSQLTQGGIKHSGGPLLLYQTHHQRAGSDIDFRQHPYGGGRRRLALLALA